MTSLEAYQSLLEKVNRNDSNTNIHVPRGKFVNLFNKQRLIWLNDKLDKNKSSQNLDDVEDLLVDDTELNFVENRRNFARFELPSDFFEFSSSYSLATKGECTNRVLTNWNTKSPDLRVLLNDDNNKPSFEYEETLCSIASGHMRVFFTDFSVDSVFLSYYREPKKIDLEGYIRIDGSPSTNSDPDISDDLVEQIIDYCATEIMRSNQNPEGFQFSKERQS